MCVEKRFKFGGDVNQCFINLEFLHLVSGGGYDISLTKQSRQG